MKKLFLLAFVLFGFALSAEAQSDAQAIISKHAIGIRFGGNDGFGGEISYQHALGGNNRLELDLGWRDSKNHDAFKLTGLYHWVFGLGQGFNWFAGAGGGIVSWDRKDKRGNDDDDGFGIFVAGNIGIEYHFSIPLMIALDFRPEIGFGDHYNDNLDLDIALSVRYKF